VRSWRSTRSVWSCRRDWEAKRLSGSEGIAGWRETYGFRVGNFAGEEDGNHHPVFIDLRLGQMCPLVDEGSVFGSVAEKTGVGSDGGDYGRRSEHTCSRKRAERKRKKAQIRYHDIDTESFRQG
jgi:hypothetical protein